MGGSATDARPFIVQPGTTDPRLRAFTKASPNVETLGPNLPALPLPPDEDLERVALLWSEMLDYFAEPKTWGELTQAERAAAVALWRQAYALGPLPEDTESATPTAAEWDNWPSQGDHTERRVYWWRRARGDARLYKQMQVQKWSAAEKRWRIFNKWGQDLTFVWDPSAQVWRAGWDFGDWWTQNAQAIGAAIQGVAYALMTVASFGAAGAAGAATAAATIGAGKAMAAGMGALVAGDAQGAISAFLAVATQIGAAGSAVGVNVGAELAKGVPDAAKALAKDPAWQTIGRVAADAAAVTGKLDLSSLVKSAQAIGKTLTPPTPEELASARAQVPPQMAIWFDWGRRDALAGALAVAPWYAQSAYAAGATLGAVEAANVVHAARLRQAPHRATRFHHPTQATRLRASPPSPPSPPAVAPAARVTPAKAAATLAVIVAAAAAAARFL